MNATYMNRHGFKVVEGGEPSPKKKHKGDEEFFDETLPTWNCKNKLCRVQGISNQETVCPKCGTSKK